MTARLFCTKRIHFLCAVCTGFVVSVWGLWYNNSKSAACAAMCMDAVFAAFGRLGAAQEMGGRAMRILGIDRDMPSSASARWIIPETLLPRFSMGPSPQRRIRPLRTRLSEIYDDMTQLLAAVKPDAMAIETLFYTTNQKTVIAVAEARGVLLLCARQARRAGVRIYAAAGKAKRFRLRKGHKKAGAGNDQDAFEAARRAQTGRHGRRAGYGHLPCVQLPFQTVWRGADKAPANGIFLI